MLFPRLLVKQTEVSLSEPLALTAYLILRTQRLTVRHPTTLSTMMMR